MDLILINGKVRTMDSSRPYAEAVAIKDGIIKKVGRNEEILKYADKDTSIEDMGGRGWNQDIFNMDLDSIKDVNMELTIF
ncbi:MAG: hypothetical protein Q8930_13550 [Bacillota bacterium]|nr:hypothetical protein [Bacillota bacterium]